MKYVEETQIVRLRASYEAGRITDSSGATWWVVETIRPGCGVIIRDEQFRREYEQATAGREP